jgi:phage protein D/phage baseplate assembly protein gpV
MPKDPDILAAAMAITIDGQPLGDHGPMHTNEVRVESHAELAGTFRIECWDDHSLKLIDDPPFAIGADVKIDMGFFGGMTEVITGVVAVVQPSFPQSRPPGLTVIGYDRSHPLRHGTRFRQFHGLNDSGIAGQVAQLHQLRPQTDGTSLPARDAVSHLGTDWQLLQTLAVRNGFEVKVEGNTLHFRKPQANPPAITLTWGQDLYNFSPRITASALPQQVRVRDYDDVQAQPVVAVEHFTGLSGDYKHDAARVPSGIAPAVTPLGEWLARGPSTPTVVEADRLAGSILNELAEGLISGSGQCVGNPGLKAGELVRIEGIGKRFSGLYRLRQVIHSYDALGYVTSFEVGPRHSTTLLEQLRRSLNGGPGSSAGPSDSSRMTPLAATVVDTKDPAGRGRARVTFRQFSDDNQGPWARIATLAAGAGTGTVFLPEVGDDVLVLFEQGDINRPIIVGALWDGQNKPPETNADGKNNVQMIKTRAGHTIKFDNTAESESLLIEHASGSTIKLDLDGITLESKDKLTLKGKSLEIEATSGNVTVTSPKEVKMVANNVDVQVKVEMNVH